MHTQLVPSRDGAATESGAVVGFRNPALEQMVAVGAVSARSCRLWIRAPRSGSIEVRYWPEHRPAAATTVSFDAAERCSHDHVVVVSLPPATQDVLPLEPLASYRFRVAYADDARLIGEGRFETAPADPPSTPARFAIAVMSCNQPFDAQGSLTTHGAAMLRAARTCLEEHHTKLVLTVGDQMYTDQPPALSLFDDRYFRRVAPPGRERIEHCTAAEVRALLQQRYRHFWNQSGWRALHVEYPCYPILDDHELTDNWGSDPAHRSSRWHAFGEGARAAYLDYQGARVEGSPDRLPEDFDYSIDYGAMGIYVLDLRSNRTVGDGARVYSERQMARLERFLEESADRKIVALALSVPLVHLPRGGARFAHWLTPSGEDYSDRWSTAGHVGARDRLIRRLHRHQLEHPTQRVLLLSGDIHIGCVHEIAWESGARPLFQLISSGITHRAGMLTRIACDLSIRCNLKIATQARDLWAKVRLVRGTRGFHRNPYRGLNLGLAEFARDDDSGDFRVRFKLYGHRGDQPICKYASTWL